jgi:hypothetical protein
VFSPILHAVWKEPRPDVFLVEFYKSFYDFLKEYFLLVVRKSQREGKVFGPLNSNFFVSFQKNSPRNLMMIFALYLVSMSSTNSSPKSFLRG